MPSMALEVKCCLAWDKEVVGGGMGRGNNEVVLLLLPAGPPNWIAATAQTAGKKL